MRVALAAAACLALSALSCTAATPSAPTSASVPVAVPSIGIPSPATSAPVGTPSATATATLPATATPSQFAPTATPSSPSSSASSSPLAMATPAADCVNGWMAPAAGSSEYAAAFEMIESQMGTSGPWTLDEMRYFTGPDVPWIIDPHYDVVDYWYVKAARVDDPHFQGRWLLEQRTDTVRGISAAAPHETTGYASPDWTGFVGDGRPKKYVGLPGTWPGIPYDFVTGEGDSGQPGLPDQVVGCLSGT